MSVSRLLPKLFGRTLEAALDWAERIIVFFEQEVLGELTEGNPPVGSVIDIAATTYTVPPGWLLCDGSVVAQSNFPLLFDLLGTTFNTGGEGAGNFRLPNSTVTISGVAGCKRIIRHD